MFSTGPAAGQGLRDAQQPEKPPKRPRFGEPQKFLPVAFAASTIAGLYLTYMSHHIAPLLLTGDPGAQYGMQAEEDLLARRRGRWQCLWFHVLTALLVACYVRSVLVHPGEIPDNDSQWEYGQDGRSGFDFSQVTQEVKKTGERRHCKWCGKYKPDRCHHCRVCKTCILKMDHHCPWIYNCVGMKNYKHFFLLLLYTVLDTQLILWTMAESVKRCIDEPSTPFVTMFTTFFGWTLNLFLTVLLTAFFGFHIWLMLKAMTTIEFCEKSGAKDSNRRYASSVYDLGLSGNVRAVLGDNVLLWLLPCGGKQGDGLHFVSDESRLSRDIATGKGIRRKGHQTAQRAQRQDEGGGSHYFYGGGSPYGSPQAPH
ncbi:unnamed protein product [Prorocentrum cordatum]|uniref:Palmitoyltransferase n=1 Tax=Prorocentrum cordatum TaxID=2364126 RepID=A0ABN9T1U0_9DINO|nr:unnamed protein product [Polarella glacialis]